MPRTAHLLLAVLACCGARAAHAADLPPVDADPEEEPSQLVEQLPEEMAALLVDPLTIAKAPPFLAGERLQYKLGWSMFRVARAVVQVAPEAYEGRPAHHIMLQARTNAFADAFYRVRNRSDSWIAADVSRSFEYKAQQDEGNRHRDIRAVFDTAAGTVRHINLKTGEARAPVPILPGTFDPLGIVFFVRSIDFDVGDAIVVPTSNGKEFFYTVVHVVDKVKRHFSYGRMEAWVLEPDIKDIGGVFKRSPDGKIRLYVSADERKLPLRMESEVAVGRFWAELVKIGPAEPDAELPDEDTDTAPADQLQSPR